MSDKSRDKTPSPERPSGMAREIRREEPQIVFITVSDYEVFVSLKIQLGQKWSAFLKILDLYNNRIIGRTELGNLSRDLIGGNTKIYNEFRTKVIARLPLRRKLLDTEDEGEMEVEDDHKEVEEGQNVSYRELTEEEKLEKRGECSGRTALCDEVLNDNWISSRDSSTSPLIPSSISSQVRLRLSAKAQEFEDTMVELDVIASQQNNLHSKLLEVQKRISSATGSEITIDPAEFTALHRQSLRMLYGDLTHTIEEKMCQNPRSVIPVILSRLEQKQDEWKRHKAEEEEDWKKRVEEDYLQSLDCRIDEWKDEDAKALDGDAIQQEALVRYSERKKRLQERVLHSISQF